MHKYSHTPRTIYPHIYMVPTNLPCLPGRVEQADLTQGPVDPDSYMYYVY